MERDAAVWVDQLSRLIAAARAGTGPVQVAGLMAQVQRMSGWALRAAVDEAREQGVTWRELARHVDVPFGTLHRQYQAGGGLQVVRPGTDDQPPEITDTEPELTQPELTQPELTQPELTQPELTQPELPDTEPPDTEPPDTELDPPEPAAGAADEAETEAGDEIAAEPSLAPGQLPAALDSFVGRDQELADVGRLLGRSRLLTVTGPAGAGKTRLALEVATRVRRSYHDQVWLVELAPVNSPDLVAQTIAAALGVPEQPGESLLDTLAATLGQRRALLVVDNCEHVVDTAALLVEALLQRCAGLRVLATSREALQATGEVTVTLGPLPVPAPEDPADRVALLRSDAVRLFLDRARAAIPGFELTAENGPAIAAICTHLDGLPLAIELATRRLRMLPPDQLLAHLEDRFHLLAMPQRQAPGRQRSLHAAIEWSHSLLTPAERTVFRRLSVFAGSSDLVAARTVCADETLSPADVVDALANLEAKSLLTAGGDGRFRQLESIRMYGREQLEAAGEQDAVYDRLLDWFAGLAQPLVILYETPPWLTTSLVQEQDTLAHAVEWALARRDPRSVLLAIALTQHWRTSGYAAEGRRLLERALEHERGSAVHRGFGYSELALFALWQGDYGTARRLSEESLRILRPVGEPVPLVRGLASLGRAFMGLGDPGRAVQLISERLEYVGRLGEPLTVAQCEQELAWTALQADDFDLAARMIARSLPVLREGGEPDRLSAPTHTAGALALVQGDLAKAEEYFVEALQLAVAFWEIDGELYNVEGLGLIAAHRNDAERALRLLGGASAHRSALRLQAENWWRARVDEAEAHVRRLLPARRADGAARGGAKIDRGRLVQYALGGGWAGTGAAASPLTAREGEVVALVAKGMTNAQIARRLRMSERTVVSHLEHIRTKLDLPSRAQIAVWAAEQSATV